MEGSSYFLTFLRIMLLFLKKNLWRPTLRIMKSIKYMYQTFWWVNSCLSRYFKEDLSTNLNITILHQIKLFDNYTFIIHLWWQPHWLKLSFFYRLAILVILCHNYPFLHKKWPFLHQQIPSLACTSSAVALNHNDAMICPCISLIDLPKHGELIDLLPHMDLKFLSALIIM